MAAEKKKKTTSARSASGSTVAAPAGRVRRQQLNVPLNEDWAARLPELLAKFQKATGIGDVYMPDVVMAGFDLLAQWCDLRIESRAAEVGELKEPATPATAPARRGRPRKTAG